MVQSTKQNVPMVEEDFITKIETIEGNTIYVLSRFKTHQTNVKTLFALGMITVYEGGKKMNYYYGEMISSECLNGSLVWDHSYFRRLRGALAHQAKEASYSFTNTDPEATNQYKYLRVAFRIARGAELVFLNVKCTIVTTARVMESLLDECIRINRDKIRYTEEQERRIQSTDTEKEMLLENLTTEALSKKELENDLIDKFTLVFMEKKKKIKELQAQIEKKQLSMQLESTGNPPQSNDGIASEQEQSKGNEIIPLSLSFGSLPMTQMTQPTSLEIPQSLLPSVSQPSQSEKKAVKKTLSTPNLQKSTSLSEFLA